MLDRKDINDNPAIDTSLMHQGKFHELERPLQSAKRDISLAEDNHFATAWRHRAIVQINEAKRHVELAVQRDRADDQQQEH